MIKMDKLQIYLNKYIIKYLKNQVNFKYKNIY